MSTMTGDEVVVTTEHDGIGGWRTEAFRRWRASSDGVVINCEESEPVGIHVSDPHPEMVKAAAHAHALEYLVAMAPAKKQLSQLFIRGRIGSPGEVEQLEAMERAGDLDTDMKDWHDDF
ncbi:hypothetical protein LG293_16275 (plasmid) [Citricoccus nitrophenolicus]